MRSFDGAGPLGDATTGALAVDGEPFPPTAPRERVTATADEIAAPAASSRPRSLISSTTAPCWRAPRRSSRHPEVLQVACTWGLCVFRRGVEGGSQYADLLSGTDRPGSRGRRGRAPGGPMEMPTVWLGACGRFCSPDALGGDEMLHDMVHGTSAVPSDLCVCVCLKSEGRRFAPPGHHPKPQVGTL
jgi:hypothetical protein